MKTKLVAIGAVLAMQTAAGAAVSILNCFSGTSTTDSVSVGGSLISGLSSNSAVIGPGWDTTVSLGVGVASTLTAEIDGSGSFAVSVGGLAGVGGSVVSTRQFSGQTFDDFTTYEITIDVSNVSNLTLLDSVNLEVGYNAGSGQQMLADTGSGFGLFGAVNLLSLFNTAGTATIQFTTGDVPDGAELYLTIDQDVTTSLLGAETVYEGISIQAIPEPQGAVLLLGSLGFMLMFRRRANRR